jgi:hypothetical protein
LFRDSPGNCWFSREGSWSNSRAKIRRHCSSREQFLFCRGVHFHTPRIERIQLIAVAGSPNSRIREYLVVFSDLLYHFRSQGVARE